MKGEEAAGLFEKEVLEADALNRIRWDPVLSSGDFAVRYFDRARRGLVEVPYNKIRLEGDFFAVGESLIPLHRIREIVYKGRVVWNKRRNR